jgi:chemotaxis protein CheC
MDENIQLTELQRDAITELLNIGMGQAANSLSEMVGEEVELSVPSLELLTRQSVAERLHRESPKRIVAVKQNFQGPFWGEALLLFPEEKSLALVRALIKQEVPLEVLIELEQDALTEVGNIILNACLSSLANILTADLMSELPKYLTGTAFEVLNADKARTQEVVMFLRMDFALHSQDIDGYVAFILEIPSIENFKEDVDKYLLAQM